jgi:hypothetical protein
MVQQQSKVRRARFLRARARYVFHHGRQIEDQDNLSVSQDGSPVYQIGSEGLIVQSLDD